MSPALQGALGGEAQVGLCCCVPGVVPVPQSPVLSSLQCHSLGEKSRIASLLPQELSCLCRSEDTAPRVEGKELFSVWELRVTLLGAGLATAVTHCE